jgi:hypothetical protein
MDLLASLADSVKALEDTAVAGIPILARVARTRPSRKRVMATVIGPPTPGVDGTRVTELPETIHVAEVVEALPVPPTPPTVDSPMTEVPVPDFAPPQQPPPPPPKQTAMQSTQGVDEVPTVSSSAIAIAQPLPAVSTHVLPYASRPRAPYAIPCAWLDTEDPMHEEMPAGPFLSTMLGGMLWRGVNHGGPFSQTRHTVGRFLFQCSDDGGRRGGGSKTVHLVFEVGPQEEQRSPPNKTTRVQPKEEDDDDTMSDVTGVTDDVPAAAVAAAAAASARRDIVAIYLKCYSYRMLLNRNAHYQRGRYGCVMLSPSLGYYVTAVNTNNANLVMMHAQGWQLADATTHATGTDGRTPLALAVGTTYMVTVVSDRPHYTARLISEQHHQDLRIEWKTPAQVQMHARDRFQRSAPTAQDGRVVGRSCLSCRDSKSGCDAQRPCAPCASMQRADACVGRAPSQAPTRESVPAPRSWEDEMLEHAYRMGFAAATHAHRQHAYATNPYGTFTPPALVPGTSLQA